MAKDTPPNNQTFSEVVGEWQRHLLQLDRRNNLLYFKPGRSPVRIVGQGVEEIVQTLSSSNNGLKFDYAVSRTRKPSNRFAPTVPDDDTEIEPYVTPGDIRGDCSPLDLQRRLGNLRRRTREWQLEQGLNVLFLAVGFLKWIDQDGQEAKSPLLLLPCDLTRESPRDAFVLKSADDDFTLNATLAVKLQEFGLNLPEEESDFETAGEYLDWVKGLVADRTDWEVTDDLYLGTFAYSKLAMWRDLGIIKENDTDHPVVRTLAGAEPLEAENTTPSAKASELPNDLSGGALDDVLDVRDQYAVLPADYSQLLAIRAAKSESNLIVHGPPGTGKSQTIANMIATFMADGKSVLFVSEKTAALDVVKHRLEDKDLGVFCLDLHSERGKKANVYQQLRMSVDEPRTIRRIEFDYEALSQRRQQLNRVVRLTHQVRQPFGRTLFQVQGRFSELHNAPHDPFEVNEIDKLDQKRLTEMLEAAVGIRLRSREFQEHSTSHWRILRLGAPPLELANRIRQDMASLVSAIQKIQSITFGVSEPLGLNSALTLDELSIQECVSRHFVTAPGVPVDWFKKGVIERLRTVVESQSTLQTERSELVEHLGKSFGIPIPEWNFEDLHKNLSVSPEQERSLIPILGENWDERIRRDHRTSSEFREFSDTLDRFKAIGRDLCEFLSLTEANETPEGLIRNELVRQIGDVSPIPLLWSDRGETAQIVVDIGTARELIHDLEEREGRIFSKLDPSVMDLVDHEMLVRYRTDHQSRFRRLTGSSYRSDRKAIQGSQRIPKKMSLADQLNIVGEIIDLQTRLKAWEAHSTVLGPRLGRRFRGRDSNWESILTDVEITDQLMDNPIVDRLILVKLLTDDDAALQSQEIVRRFDEAYTEFENSIVRSLPDQLSNEILDGGINYSELDDLIQKGLIIINQLEDAANQPLGEARGGISDLSGLRVPVASGARLAEIERSQLEANLTLESDFKSRFNGFETDWQAVSSSLNWADELLRKIPSEWAIPGLLANAENPQPRQINENVSAIAADALVEFHNKIDGLADRYDLDTGPWGKLVQSGFNSVIQGAETIINDADFASDWLAYQAVAQRLDELIASGTVESIRRQTEDSEMVPQIVERRVLGKWLDLIYQQEPLLGDFSPSNQDDLISRFKELDQLLTMAAQIEVRKKVLERYPEIILRSTNNGPAVALRGELGTLRGELSKRRRQWPVRALFRTIPRLIQQLKPCFFMSPLAVSQFLPLSADDSKSLKFDVVIFDEASQVHPEDAVPAIVRAKQSIFAGDQKQLPPSNFWRHSLDEDDAGNDDPDEEENDRLAGRESILDASVGLVGQIFSEEYLNVHYRSQDESLIRFSNHHFYGDRLLTFPSPGAKGSWMGVHDEYVSEGRYDAGGTRTNRIEADRVVDIVFEHMRTRPIGESLGVVAMSRPQADLIERLIDQRRILERDTDEKFTANPEEPFFVKNLENVQGDERDHMIISIGYGPTVGSGAVPNRFGPLNSAGGERRLNVVVTRAKQRVDLVHSLRASDIRSQQSGARLLKRYLEYAENPQQAFESQVEVDEAAESESPFESAVEAALLSKGYKIARQVGVSGYRIDLGILSEDGTGFDLGIECDGWTYHSAPAARDRDWLRQQVLEGLGWTIHRVWSTAWVRNPESELARIEGALERAQAKKNASTLLPIPEFVEAPIDITDLELEEIGSVHPTLNAIELEDYESTKIPNAPNWSELGSETNQKLVELIGQIAEIEGPVHRDVVIERLRNVYGLGRVRGSTREHTQYAISDAIRRDAVKGDLQFVWFNDSQLSRSPRKAPDAKFEHIAPTELKTIVLGVARAFFGLTQKDLVVETARKLEFTRTGKRITEILNEVIQNLLEEGKLQESFGKLHVSDGS